MLKPALLAASSAPRATVVQKGLVISVSTKASVHVLRERKLRASVFGTYPNWRIAASTRFFVLSLM